MAQQLRIFTALASDLDSILSTHMATPTSVPGDPMPSSVLCRYRACKWHTDTQADKTTIK